MSRQISQLESELGAALVLRTTRRLSVTDAGRGFYERARAVLRDVDEARAAVRNVGAPAGTLVVSAPVSLALVMIAPQLPRLLDRHPALRIDLRLEDRVIDLVAEGVDVAIRVGVALPDSASIVAHRLADVQRVLVASPKYLRRRGRPRDPRALAGHDVLIHLPAEGSPGVWTLSRGTDTQQVAVDGSLRTNALLVLRDAAIEGRGIALLADAVLGDTIREGTLERVLPEWSGPSASVFAVHHVEQRNDPKIRALVAHLRAMAARDSGNIAPPKSERGA